jgi:hypothetical protein
MKAQRAYLYKDIAALERRVATLLTHLERAIEPAVTDLDRARFRRFLLLIARAELAHAQRALTLAGARAAGQCSALLCRHQPVSITARLT